MSWVHYPKTSFAFMLICFVSVNSRSLHRYHYRYNHPEEGDDVDDNYCYHEFQISLHNPMVVIQSTLLPHPSHPEHESCSIGVTGQYYRSAKYKISYYFNRLIFHTSDAFIRLKNGHKSQTINRQRGSFVHGKHESSLTVNPFNETFILIELSDGFLFRNNTFEIVFTAHLEKEAAGSCPRDFMDCEFEDRCIPKQLKCNGWNNCKNNEDELSCYSTQIPEPKSVTAFSILIRLSILLLIGVILRLVCIFSGCCNNGFRIPGHTINEHDSSGSPSSTRSVAGSLTDERSFNDTPPPYPGTPVQRIVRGLLGNKSETPPPSYKQAVELKNVGSSNNDDVSSKDSA